MKKYNSISIVVPIFNEIKTLPEILKRIEKASTFGLKKEIILVDDGSTDGSQRFLKKLDTKKYKVKIQKENKGKGAALKVGFENATGDIILIQDADLEYNPDQYPTLIEPIIKFNADVVYGSRFLTYKPHRVLYFWHSIGNKILTTIANVFSDLNLTDMETCYKIFTREVLVEILPNLSSERFGFEPEFTMKIAKIKPSLMIFEVGISYFGRTYNEGKKISWIDGFLAIGSIIRYRLFK
jgi:glycosyltransferase involved in cell wall biosynthesis